MRQQSRSIRLEPFDISREHIFQDEDQDEDLDDRLAERIRSEGGEIAPWWAKWKSMHSQRERPGQDSVEDVVVDHTSTDVRPFSNRITMGRSSMVTSPSQTPTPPPVLLKPVPTVLKELRSLKMSSGFVEVTTPRPRPLTRSPTESSIASSSKTPVSSKSPHFLNWLTHETPCSEESDLETLPHKAPYQVAQRQMKLDKIQSDWNAAVKLANAAPVKIVNEVDDEILPLPKGFEYMERGYHSEDADNRDEFMSGCDCLHGSCKYARNCCVEQTRMDEKIFPYTEGGLFTFNIPRGIEIFECNKKCSCDDTCRNRVAQKPRKVSLEVFKTRKCGWGVRATVRLQRGQVIGTYSGKLVKTKQVDKFSNIRRSYLFDLDHMDGGDDETLPSERYSVDGYMEGNWGRFINHSCEPNLQVWPVLYDTAEINKPYLAFIATKAIPIKTELTLDYNPTANFDYDDKGKGKGKGNDCLCESERCRGRIL